MTNIPATTGGTMTDPPVYFHCPVCGAIQTSEPPHGWNQPCPQKVKIDEAYVAKLDAERMYYLRGGVNVERLADTLERISGTDETE